MPTRRRLDDALNRLAQAEGAFFQKEFIAPVVGGGEVRIRIAGVICSMRVFPDGHSGWGIFRTVSPNRADLVRPARLAERQRYLELFPLVRLILTDLVDDVWLAFPAHQADARFRIVGLVPVRLVDEGQRFDVVQTRFDARHFWYECADPRWDPARGGYLRKSLEEMLAPDQLQRSGLTAEERAAYALCFQQRFQATEEGRRLQSEERLRQALAQAGANLQGFRDRGDVWTVTYEVDGERHVSAVNKQDLSVQVAGICLDGMDEAFDLQSLVGVIREGRTAGELIRVGDENQGMDEEVYWQVHPPRNRPQP